MVVGVVPVDLELVVVPVRVRHVSIGIARPAICLILSMSPIIFNKII